MKVVIVMKILQSENIYKSFYSKLFIDHANPAYITLLFKAYLTEGGTIYLEGQNLENQVVLNTLEEQRKIIQSNLETWESSTDSYPANSKKALEFFRDKLEFLNKISETLKN